MNLVYANVVLNKRCDKEGNSFHIAPVAIKHYVAD